MTTSELVLGQNLADVYPGIQYTTAPITSRSARKNASYEVNLGIDASSVPEGKQANWFSGPTTKGVLARPQLYDKDKKIFSGYLTGSRPSISLDYAMNFFFPNGDPESPLATPLTEESYHDFVTTMYQQFMLGKLPGSVSFDQPSYDDVQTVLMSNPKIALHSTRFPIKRGHSISLEKPIHPGIVGAQFEPDLYEAKSYPIPREEEQGREFRKRGKK